MKKKGVTNISHSVRERLLILAREDGTDYGLVLSRYVVERFLYRLSRTKHSGRFVLKGAMLFAVWTHRPHRPTRDLDLLGYGDLSDDALWKAFADVAEIVEADGLNFDVDTLEIADIRAEEEYQGKRARMIVHLGTARVHLQVDIGVGDAVTPPAEEVAYPVLLDMPAPRLRAYAKETVIAEKLQAMASLGMLNSRMKDFYDLWVMGNSFAFDESTLAEAIRATFERRRTAMTSDLPVGLTDAFWQDSSKQAQWRAFIGSQSDEHDELSLHGIVDSLRHFLEVPYQTAASGQPSRKMRWLPGGPKWSLGSGS